MQEVNIAKLLTKDLKKANEYLKKIIEELRADIPEF